MEWLTPQNVALLISAILTGVGGTYVVQGIFARRKTRAEAQNLEITGDMSLGKGWQEYAQQQKKDKEEVTRKFEEILGVKEGIITGLEEANKKLVRENTVVTTERDGCLIDRGRLTSENAELNRQLGKYTGMEQKIDVAAGKLHSEIDHAADSLKNPEQTHG